MPLDRKIMITQARITEWYLHYGGKVYVSFSGGKDSTVLLHIARQCFPDIEAVFVDTGLEYPEVREHVKTFENVTWIRPEMNFRKVIETYGYPVISKEVAGAIETTKRNPACATAMKMYGTAKDNNGNPSKFNHQKYKFLLDAPFKISGKCCNHMKEQPIRKFEKSSGKHSMIGTLAEESVSRKMSWFKTGCNAFNGTVPKSKPLSFWTEQDVLEYIRRYNIQIPSVYGEIITDERGKLTMNGCQRTGCVFCMFGCHLEKEPNRFQQLKNTHPKLYEYCMRPWSKGGLGLDTVLEYIHVKH